jgi:hypothetical protein
MVPPDTDEAVRFEAQIRPLFRPRDRSSMKAIKNFDLWSYEDVSARADLILKRLATGSMPCDGAWPQEKVGIFRRWVEGGKLT